MKKKDIILISVIIILLISLIGTIIYFTKSENLTTEGEVLIVGSNYLLVGTTDGTDYIIKNDNKKYQEGDKLKLTLTNIKKDELPYEAKAKKIIRIKENENNNQQNTNQENNQPNENSSNNQQQENTQTNQNNNQTIVSTEEDIVSYFENLNNQVKKYNTNSNDESLSKTIKSKFVECVDFIFYGTKIKGKTFEELSNEAKIKIISLALSVDSKIDEYFPGYKDTISNKYQSIKSKLIEKYLETTTNICNNDPNLCQTAKENFSSLKENFGITWDLIKDIASNGLSKLKDWYEIWRYN